MQLAESELSKLSEQFPNFDHGGNLIFYAHSSGEKLRSILSVGIKPRGGLVEGGSYFPHVVSLSAVGDKGIGGLNVTLNGNLTIIFNTSFDTRYQYNPDLFYNFGIILQPSWVESNIQKFKGVGEFICLDHYKDHFLQNSLSQLPLSQIPEDVDGKGPFPDEVHYQAGILPPESIAGVLIDEDNDRFIRANQTFRQVVSSVKSEGIQLPPLALYTNRGNIYDVLS